MSFIQQMFIFKSLFVFLLFFFPFEYLMDHTIDFTLTSLQLSLFNNSQNSHLSCKPNEQIL